jgi:hypothetical protein
MRIPTDMTPSEFGIMVALRYNDNNKKATASMLDRSIRRVQQVSAKHSSFMSKDMAMN